MPDVLVVFTKPLPFSVSLQGRRWGVGLHTGMKSGMLALTAKETSGAVSRRKWYVLTAGKERDVIRDLGKGILVRAGTPERGLVTAMRRAGVVRLLPASSLKG